jgi:Glycosyltransferase
MKKILILTTVSGFLCKFEKENVKILQQLGYSVHYAANALEQQYVFDESEIENMGVQLHHIDIERSPYMIKKNRKAFIQLIKIIEENDIQIIHCHTPVGSLLGRLIGRYFSRKKRDLKIIYTVHGFHFYRNAPLLNNIVYYSVEKCLARYTDKLIVINQEDYQAARKLRLKASGKIYKIPGIGLATEKFKEMLPEERQTRRSELGLSENDFFMVSVGELNENKNQAVVLQALAKMRSNNIDISNIKYGICGTGFFEDRLKNQIEELKLEDVVTMYGYCVDVSKILGCADISIFPSKREGLGMAGLEALAMGVPLIAANNRGTREYMQHLKNGYVCKNNDIDEYIEAIQIMQNLKLSKMVEMKQYCQESVKPFIKEKTIKIMKKVYSELEEKPEKKVTRGNVEE